MARHSKWHKLKNKKGKTDSARANEFTKLCRAVTMAAQQGGADPAMNFSLRLAIEKAKAANVPKDNIERAIKRGAGELQDGVKLEELLYEGFGPGSVGYLIEAVTDNRNRSASDVKTLLSKHGGSLGGPGSVQWQFSKFGVMRISEIRGKLTALGRGMDDFQLAVIDAGAADVLESEFGIEIRTAPEKISSVLDSVHSFDIEPDDVTLEWIGKDLLNIDETAHQANETLCDALEELDDVKAVYTNEA